MYVGHWNLTTDILHNLRNTERILFRFIFYCKVLPPSNGISLKIRLFLTESSHDIVESSHYIPRDRSHMRTTGIEVNSGAVMARISSETLLSVSFLRVR